MRSLVTSKNISWPRLIWPTLYIIYNFRTAVQGIGNQNEVAVTVGQEVQLSQRGREMHRVVKNFAVTLSLKVIRICTAE